jgi:hypothetical protein
MSVCVKCFYLKTVPYWWFLAHCDLNEFSGALDIEDPFLSMPRACQKFDEDLCEEVMSDCLKRGPGKL